MRSAFVRLIAGALAIGAGAALAFGLPPIALTNVLLDKPGIVVVAADDFPKTMACQIKLGSELGYRFRADGDEGKIKSAQINIDLTSTVLAVRRKTKKESYALILFLIDRDRNGVSLYDLNCNGEWVVKKMATKEIKNYIRIGADWLPVDDIDDVLVDAPKAKRGNERYQFDGVWKRM